MAENNRRGYVASDGSVVRPKSIPVKKAPPSSVPHSSRLRDTMNRGDVKSRPPVYGNVSTQRQPPRRPTPIPVGTSRQNPPAPPQRKAPISPKQPVQQPRPQRPQIPNRQIPPQRQNPVPVRQRPVQQTSKQQGRQNPPMPSRQRPANQPPRQNVKKQAPQKGRSPQQNNWVMPEGNTVYTAQGQYRQPRPRPTQVPPPRPKRPTQKQRKQKRAELFNSVIWGIKAFCIRFAVMLLVSAGVMFFMYRTEFCTSGEGGSDVTYIFDPSGRNTDKVSFEAPAASAYYSGIRYVDMTQCAEWFNMAEIGSVGSMRYVITDPENRISAGSGTEEYVIFTNNSNGASVDGTTVIMNAPCRTIGSHVWVPLSFIENYITGIEVSGATGDTVTLATEFAKDVREEKIELKKEEKAPDVSVGFSLCRSVPIEFPDYPE